MHRYTQFNKRDSNVCLSEVVLNTRHCLTFLAQLRSNFDHSCLIIITISINYYHQHS